MGAAVPAEAKPSGEQPEAKAPAAQVTYVPLAEAELRNMSRERISALIEQLKAGTYDASAWDVPF